MPKFFPAPATVVRKLFKGTIALLWDWKERERITQDILQWLKNKLEELDSEAILKCYANECVNTRTQAAEMQGDIDRQAAQIQKMKVYLEEMPKGYGKKAYRAKIQDENEKLKALKLKQKSLMEHSRFYKANFNKVQATVNKYKSNIELIEKLTEGWF